MKLLLVALLCCLAAPSCAPPTDDPAKVRAEIAAITEKSEKNLLNGTVDTVLADYTDDAISLPSNEPMVRGKAALKEMVKKMNSMGLTWKKVEFTTMDVHSSGTLAYEIGTYAMALEKAEGGEWSDEGKYLTIYERGADGKWRIKVETYNTNRPLESAEPGS